MELSIVTERFFMEMTEEVKSRTRQHYQTLSGLCLKDLGKMELKRATSESVTQAFLRFYGARKEMSVATFNSIKSLFNRVLYYAHKKGYTKERITIETNIKSEVHKVESLSKSEVSVLEDYILGEKRSYSYGVLLSLYTGMRIGEVLALRWANVDFENKLLRVTATAYEMLVDHKLRYFEDTPKTRSSVREIPLTRKLESLLKEMKRAQPEESEYVVSKSGKRIAVRAYQESFSRLLRRLGIRHYGFHSLRHTFATFCYQNGMDIKTLSEILGHASPTITLKIYVHTNMETKRQAMEMVNKKLGKTHG